MFQKTLKNSAKIICGIKHFWHLGLILKLRDVDDIFEYNVR